MFEIKNFKKNGILVSIFSTLFEWNEMRKDDVFKEIQYSINENVACEEQSRLN